jgi:tetratricopeptide (TPR) repeat protein
MVMSIGLVRASADPAALLDQIQASRLDGAGAVSVSRLTVESGLGALEIEQGTVFPASRVGEKAVELVFIGEAVVRLDAPDSIEASQLELFTGDAQLAEPIEEAVLVVCHDEAIDLLLGQPAIETVADEIRGRAVQLYDEWKSSPERKALDVEAAILRDAVGDPVYSGYFAGRFESEKLGRFLLWIEPDADEQLTLGQFVAVEVTEKEERKALKQILRQQRRGRLIGLEIQDLGTWDTWVSSHLVGGDGEPHPGQPGFEPERYEIDVTIGDDGTELRGVARLGLRAVHGLTSAVRLRMSPDVRIDRVVDSGGAGLFFLQSGGEVTVLLPRMPASEEQIELTVDFQGSMIEKIKSKVFALRETILWYPHAGAVDRATYEVTLRWPSKFELVASGRVAGKGVEGRQHWERRTLDEPSIGFSFEIGDFEFHSVKAAGISVLVAFDQQAAEEGSEPYREAVVATVQDALIYYQETFGGYPLDYLTLATVPRASSQGLLGFVTLSNLLLFDFGGYAALLGLEDPRIVVAHEIAHQWWGNLVGWQSYRDQWISETMANFAALLWAKNRLPREEQPTVGPTTDWQSALLRVTEEGRPIESLGPMVLGLRLDSSHSASAYASIVYKKGAVVLNMLPYGFGEDAFLEFLRKVVLVSAGSQISTADFITYLERLFKEDLSWYAEQYIYGTGLPEVYYTYEFNPRENGKWGVRINAQQQRPYHYRYRAVRTTDGTFDVRRETVEHGSTADSSLVIPVQVAIHDPAESGKRSRKKPKQTEANKTIVGRILLDKPKFEFEFELDFEPKELWLDRDHEVYARFWAESREPKRMLMYHGIDGLAAGRSDEAEDYFHRALEAEVDDDEDRDPDERAADKYLDARIHVYLARLHTDRGNVGEARAALGRATDLRRASRTPFVQEQIKILECRLDLLEGNHTRVVDQLRKSVRGKRPSGNTEGYVLLAIAARASGETQIFEKAAELSREQGADLSALEESR